MTKKSKNFLKKNEILEGAFSDRLKAACAGWFYMSETDAAVEPFFGGKVGKIKKETILEVIGDPQSTEVEEGDLANFFTHLYLMEDSKPSRPQNLQQFLEQNLADLKVFRVGRIRIDVYVVGLDQEGNLAGVKTVAVET